MFTTRCTLSLKMNKAYEYLKERYYYLEVYTKIHEFLFVDFIDDFTLFIEECNNEYKIEKRYHPNYIGDIDCNIYRVRSVIDLKNFIDKEIYMQVYQVNIGE